MLSNLLKGKGPRWTEYKNIINGKSINLEFMINESETGLKITSVLSTKKMLDKSMQNMKERIFF